MTPKRTGTDDAMSPPTPGPWTYHDGEIFAQNDQEPPLLIAADVHPANARLIAQAPALLEFVKFAITEEGATCYQHPSKPAFFIKRLDAITQQARALLRQIEEGRP